MKLFLVVTVIMFTYYLKFNTPLSCSLKIGICLYVLIFIFFFVFIFVCIYYYFFFFDFCFSVLLRFNCPLFHFFVCPWRFLCMIRITYFRVSIRYRQCFFCSKICFYSFIYGGSNDSNKLLFIYQFLCYFSFSIRVRFYIIHIVVFSRPIYYFTHKVVHIFWWPR